MKSVKLKLSMLAICLIMSSTLFAQVEAPEETVSEEKKTYLGIGIGFDYGGFGGKIEHLPTKHVGFFAGLGYNLSSLGCNIGLDYKFSPDKKTSLNLLAMYGYNAVLIGKDIYTSQYDVTSYSFTFGATVDIFTKRRNNKWTIGLLFPIRSEKFLNNYNALKKNSNVKMEGELLPIAFSLGFNFKI
jgi:hypothetical protein